MTCNDCQQALLQEPRTGAAVAHLETCPDCHAFDRDWQRLAAALPPLAEFAPPTKLDGIIRAEARLRHLGSLREPDVERPDTRWRRVWSLSGHDGRVIGMAIAAMALVVFMLGAAVMMRYALAPEPRLAGQSSVPKPATVTGTAAVACASSWLDTKLDSALAALESRWQDMPPPTVVTGDAPDSDAPASDVERQLERYEWQAVLDLDES